LQRIKTRNRDVAGTEEYRREFLGNVSHELKPLYLLSKDYISTLLDRLWRIKLFGTLNVPKRSVLYIVEDLDMITKLESGDLNLVY
jgi:two-component system phosphate regulon sensor histidine kinase PhoR